MDDYTLFKLTEIRHDDALAEAKCHRLIALVNKNRTRQKRTSQIKQLTTLIVTITHWI